MSLSAGQHAFMPAVSGLLRSGASRSDWHPTGTKVPLYALSNVARSNATRSGYVGSRSFISIDGIVLPPRVTALDPGILIDSLQITDLLNYEANRCTFVAWGWTPKEGQRITVTIGSVNNRNRLFAGRILNTEQFYQGKPANLYVSVNAIDDTWGLDARKVSERYTATTYEAVVKDLLAKYAAPTYTAAVEPGLGSLEEITFTNQDLTSALTQLAKRGGYQWLCDETAVIRFFQTDTSGTAPTILNAAHPSLDRFRVQRDLSQLVTRVYVEGGGVVAFAAVAVGETILPVEDAAWYPSSGVVVCGPQRIRYSGKYPGGGGGLVGPGASPSGRPLVALASGTGLSDGPRSYAVTYTTASGESIPSPPAAITVGPLTPPATAPEVGAPTIGTGPDPGPHRYAVTFVSTAGETTPGPTVDVVTGETPAPSAYPVPGVPIVQTAPGVSLGTHEYAVSFVTAAGETTVGPISSSVTTTPLPPPAPAPTGATAPWPSNVPQEWPGTRSYAVTFVTATGETTPGPSVAIVPPACPPPAEAMQVYAYGGSAGSGNLVNGARYLWAMTFVDPATGNETAGGPTTDPAFLATASGLANFSYVPYVNGYYAKVYRTVAWGTTFYHELGPTYITNIQQAGQMSDAVLVTRPQAPAPKYVPAVRQYSLAGIPLGDASVTARKIYRTSPYLADGQLHFVTTLANNTATTFTDNDSVVPGAPPPTTNTAITNNKIPLTAIPVGGSGVTGRKLYRRSGGVGLRYLATLSGNSSTTYTDTTDNAALGAAPPATTTATLNRFALSAIPTGPALVTARNLYRTPATGGALKFLAQLANNTTTTFTDTIPDASLGAAAPGTNTARANQVQMTGIPIGASGVTSRKVYRTVAYGSSLQLLTVLADNTTTTYLDVLADGALGAVAPAVDTSGLQQPSGSVPVGATSFQIASIGPFPSEGWAVIGNGQQVIRYTAVVGNSMTGIPASGAGSIQAAIAYNSTVTASPQLVGIPATGDGRIRYPILKGDPVNLWIQADNLVAQAALAALMGTDGIIEGYLQDRRLSFTEALARAEAQLALRGELEVGISYTSRDVNTRAGRLVTVNLPSQHVVMVDFQLRQVTMTRFGIPNLLPTFTASASTDRFSFEALIRAARKDGT